jgi:hypothetical protein
MHWDCDNSRIVATMGSMVEYEGKPTPSSADARHKRKSKLSLPLLDKRQESRWDEHINGMGKECGRK